jgi:hypothetical protein
MNDLEIRRGIVNQNGGSSMLDGATILGSDDKPKASKDRGSPANHMRCRERCCTNGQ